MEFTKKAQNLKKGLNRFSHRLREQGRRICAVLLCASMVISGFPSSFFQAFASDGSEEFYYELDRESLYEAICTAVSEGTTVDRELDFTGEYAEQYAELFDADGTLYELKDLEVEKDRDRDKVLELRAFVRVEGEIPLDEYYEIDGEESVIFLLTNRSKDATSAVIYIDDLGTEMIEIVSVASVSRDGGPGANASEEISGTAGAGSGSADEGSAAEIDAEEESESDEDEEEAIEDTEDFSIGDETEDVSVAADVDAGQDDGESSASEDDGDESDKDADTADSGSGEDTGSASESSDSSSEDDSSDNSSSDGKDASDREDDSQGRDHAGRGNRPDRNDNSERGERPERNDNDHSDRENGSNDRGFSGGRGRSDNGKASDSGNSSDRGSSSGSGSNSGSGNSSGSDGSDKTASVSSNRVGLLSAALVEELVIGEESNEQGGEDEPAAPVADDSEDLTIIPADEADDIIITIDEGTDGIVVTADSDVFITADSEVTLASASDAEAEEDEDSSDSDDTSDDTIDGEIYDAVILDAKKAAVAFVTTTEDLGLDKFSHLEDQTIDAKVYEDDSYGFRLADGTSITLTGMMPVDAEVKAYPVEVEIEDVNVLAAYDITIFDKHGNEFQPEDDAIEVLIENDAIYEALDDEHELTIFHMEDEFDEPEEIATIEPAPRRLQALSFLADRFSIYVVGDGTLTDEEGVYDVYTVNFYEWVFDDSALSDDKTPISTQRVPVSDTDEEALGGDGYLNEPAVPEVLHHVFDGWYTVEQDVENEHPGYKYDFDLTVKENLDSWTGYIVGEDNVINLYSDYDPIYYVYYMTEEEFEDGELINEPDIFWTDEYHENNHELDTSTAESVYQNHTGSNKAVTDWYYYEDDENKSEETRRYISQEKDNNGGSFSVSDDLILYPVVTDVIWLYFTMGDDVGEDVEAVDPEYRSGSELIGELPEPERSGYTFDGWYYQIDSDDDSAVNDKLDILITESDDPKTVLASINGDKQPGDEGYVEWIDLFAHWTEAVVSYTINIWRQKATDGATGVNQKTIKNGETFADYIDYYDFAESIHVSAEQSQLKTGDTPTTSTVYNWSTYTSYGTITDNSSAYYGFENNAVSGNGTTTAATRTQNELQTVTMAADGSTIINIYYNRVTVTWTFPTGSGNNRNQTLVGLYGTNCSQGDDKAGDLSDWPDSSLWRIGNNGSVVTFETTFVVLDGSISITFSSQTASTDHYIYYYLEVTNDNQLNSAKESEAQGYGVAYTREVEGTTYRYEKRASTSSSASSFTLTDKYTGYEVVGYNQVTHNRTDSSTTYEGASEGESVRLTSTMGFTNYDLYIFNDARKYTITLESNGVNVGFDDQGNQIDGGNNPTYTFKYGEDVPSTILLTELDPEIFGPNYYYRFTGTWWEDPTFTAEFVKPDSMPANNLVAYADWELEEYKVTFVSYVDSNLYQTLVNLYVKAGEDPDDVITDNSGLDEDGNYVWSYTITVTAGDQLNYELDNGVEADDPEHNYEFGGWLNTDTDKIFNFKSYIYSDTTIQVFWIENEITYHLLYYPDEKEVSDDDSAVLGHAHEFNSYAEVREYAELFEDDENFLYWVGYGHDDQGNEYEIYYYPGSEIDFSKVAVEPVMAEDEYGNEYVDYYIYKLYPHWAVEDEATLILDYNYPEGYVNQEEDHNPEDESNPQHPQTSITQETLSDIDLSGSYIDDETGDEIPYDPNTRVITVTNDGETTYYWFAGWSRSADSKTAEIGANDIVAVNENQPDESGNVEENILYAVWEPIDPPEKKISGVTDNPDEPDDDNPYWAEGDPVNIGDYITYEITYTNYTDETAAITIVDVLDRGVDYMGSEPEGTYDESTHTVTWTIENVAAATSGTVTITVQVNENAETEGSISNTASVQVDDNPEIETEPVITEVGKTFDVPIYKYDPNRSKQIMLSTDVEAYDVTNWSLEGAEFILSRDVDGTTEYAVAEKSDDSYYYTYTVTKWTSDNDEATALTSNSDGYIDLTNLEAGTYTLTETKAPEGYILQEDPIVFSVDSEGYISVVSGSAEINNGRICIANTEITGSFELDKTDEDGNSLSGAEFILGYFYDVEPSFYNSTPDNEWEYWYAILDYDDTGAYVYSDQTDERDSATLLKVDENGKLSISSLIRSGINLEEYGEYYYYFLIETKAPDGYNLLTDPIVFIVDDDGTIKLDGEFNDNTHVFISTDDNGTEIMTVINEAGFELPSTGGSGTLPFRALGALLTVSALWLLFLTLRRRRRWVES